VSKSSVTQTGRVFLFRLLAVGSAIAAIYHLAGAFGILPGNHSPVWRHVLFVAIDVIIVWYLLNRPLWMFPLYVILFVQQAVSHGSHIIKLWHQQHSVDYISVVDLAALSTGLVLLTIDLRDRLRNPPAHNGRAG
jgi:hypothetical protein